MKVKLLKNLEIGRINDVIEVSFERGNYLLKVGAALEWKQTGEVADTVDKHDEQVKKVAKKPVKKATVSRKKTTKKK